MNEDKKLSSYVNRKIQEEKGKLMTLLDEIENENTTSNISKLSYDDRHRHSITSNEFHYDKVKNAISAMKVTSPTPSSSNAPTISSPKKIKRRSVWGNEEVNELISTSASINGPVLAQNIKDIQTKLDISNGKVLSLTDEVTLLKEQLQQAQSWKKRTASYAGLLSGTIKRICESKEDTIMMKPSEKLFLDRMYNALVTHVQSDMLHGSEQVPDNNDCEDNPKLSNADDTISCIGSCNAAGKVTSVESGNVHRDHMGADAHPSQYIVTRPREDQLMWKLFQLFSSLDSPAVQPVFPSSTGKLKIDRESEIGSKSPSTDACTKPGYDLLLSKRCFLLMCFVLDLFSDRVELRKVDALFKKIVMHGNSAQNKFNIRLNYHQFSWLLASMSELAFDAKAGKSVNGLPKVFSYSNSLLDQTDSNPDIACPCLTKYLRVASDKAQTLLADQERFLQAVALFEPLVLPNTFECLATHQTIVVKQYRYCKNYIRIPTSLSKQSLFESDKPIGSPKKVSTSLLNGNTGGSFVNTNSSSTSVSNIDTTVAARGILDLSKLSWKMLPECGFESLCAQSKVVPTLIKTFSTIRRATLFIRTLIAKDSGLHYMFACLSCLLVQLHCQNRNSIKGEGTRQFVKKMDGNSKESVALMGQVLMDIINQVESSSFASSSSSSADVEFTE